MQPDKFNKTYTEEHDSWACYERNFSHTSPLEQKLQPAEDLSFKEHVVEYNNNCSSMMRQSQPANHAVRS